MKSITVKGKSLKGKSRIAQFGNVWNIKIERENKILVESLCGVWLRWVDLDNDRDFVLVN